MESRNGVFAEFAVRGFAATGRAGVYLPGDFSRQISRRICREVFRLGAGANFDRRLHLVSRGQRRRSEFARRAAERSGGAPAGCRMCHLDNHDDRIRARAKKISRSHRVLLPARFFLGSAPGDEATSAVAVGAGGTRTVAESDRSGKTARRESGDCQRSAQREKFSRLPAH